MQLKVNGESQDYAGEPTLGALMQSLSIANERVAAMVDGEVIAQDAREARALQAGCEVEFLTFAGGG